MIKITEMPFPIGSQVATVVKIQDSAGNDILVDSGNLKVAEQGTIESLLSAYKSGTYIKYSGSVTNNATIYTVPNNMRMLLLTGTMHNNNTTPITQMTIEGTNPQDSLLIINAESYKSKKTASMIIVEQNLGIKIQFMSGGGSSNQCRYLIVGLLIDKV